MNILLFSNFNISISVDIGDVDVSLVGVVPFVELSPGFVENCGGIVLFNAPSTIYSARNFIIACTINSIHLLICHESVHLCKSVLDLNNNITIQIFYQFNTISTSYYSMRICQMMQLKKSDNHRHEPK